MNYCGQPFPHVKNPLAVCGMIDPERVYQCPQCAALDGPACDHGQLARTCPLCDMRDENLALRAQVDIAQKSGQMWFKATQQWGEAWHESQRQLADCQAQVADTQAQVERLHSFIEPSAHLEHGRNCAVRSIGNDDCTCCLKERTQTQTAETMRRAWTKRAIEAETKLADCQAVIEKRGHDVECPTYWCSYPVAGHLCGYISNAHTELPMGHEFQPAPCSDACGYSRTTGEK